MGYSWGSRERFPSVSGIHMGVSLGHLYMLQVLRQRKWWFQLSKIALVWLEMLATLTSTYPVYLCPAIFDMNVCLVDLLALYPKPFYP
jgi:hypothetical protein